MCDSLARLHLLWQQQGGESLRRSRLTVAWKPDWTGISMNFIIIIIISWKYSYLIVWNSTEKYPTILIINSSFDSFTKQKKVKLSLLYCAHLLMYFVLHDSKLFLYVVGAYGDISTSTLFQGVFLHREIFGSTQRGFNQPPKENHQHQNEKWYLRIKIATLSKCV